MVTPSNLRRLERLEEKSAVPDTEYENFMDNLLEARRQVAVLQIDLMDRGLEETERADLEARLKKAEASMKEIEPFPPHGSAAQDLNRAWVKPSGSA
jgi:multidrug resistance efflux pump